MKPYRLLMSLLLVPLVAPAAFAVQDHSASSRLPLVYSAENTGKSYSVPNFPDFDYLPIVRPLPDPFKFSNGFRDTSFNSWERRRNEIKAAIEKYEIGPKPDGSDCTIAATYVPAAAGADAGTLTVVVTRNSNGKSLTLSERVWLPKGMGDGPFPALIPMTLAFPPFFVPGVPNYGSLPASVFSTRPVATIDFFHNDVTAYSFFGATDHSADPFYQLYPELKSGTPDSNSGQYAAWAWGVSRLIDGIVQATHQSPNPLPIDVKHLAVTGCSYAGKMALYAGALDERVALTIPQENGGGGAASWRVSQEIEADLSVETLTHTDHNWFGSQMFQFSDNNVYKLPEDHHELMAMVAPRALLETGNTDFNWLSNRSNYISARATQRIYNTFGIGDRFGFYIDSGHGHCATLPEEAPAIAAFVDKFLLGDTTANTDVEVHPYGNLDYQRWTWWWGKILPVFPNDWNPGDGTVVSSSVKPLVIGNNATVSAGYDLAIHGSHADATIAVKGASAEVDVVELDGRSYTLTIPLPDQSYTIAAHDQSWVPSPNQNSPLVYQGSATAGKGGLSAITYFRAVGENDGVVGDPGGPGIGSDYPVTVRYHAATNDKLLGGGSWSPSITVKDATP
jgi:hypothetical protein